MGLFGRRKKDDDATQGGPSPTGSTAPGDSPDPDLDFLTVAQAARFRVVVREVLAETGREVTLRPQSVVTDDGREWGLWNVAAVAHQDERGEAGWPDVVRSHFTKLFSADATGPDDLTDEEFFGALRMRLVEQAQLAQLGPDGFDHAMEWAEGVVRVPVLDLPDTVATVPRSALETRAPLATCLDRAWANTAALVGTEELERQALDHEGRHAWVVLGDSFFTASLALVLPDLVRRFEPDADLSGGVVLAVPFRHQLVYRVVDSPSAALDALVLIPRFAALGFSDSPGPLSPHTMLWRDGEVSTLTRFEDGGLSVTPGPYLEELLSGRPGGDGSPTS